MKEMGRQGRNHKQLLDNINEKKILEIEGGSTRSQSVEKSLQKKLWS
jgi:2-C-methyl-D-erythritol 4-phosphate cytidylyltransferase